MLVNIPVFCKMTTSGLVKVSGVSKDIYPSTFRVQVNREKPQSAEPSVEYKTEWRAQ
jgi:hypothetical protein